MTLLSYKKVLACAISGIGLTVVAPVHAETEIETLKREFAEQKQLILKLLATQQSQEKVNARIEAQASAGNRNASAPTGLEVTLYGIADVNIRTMNSGFGRKVAIGSGGDEASRVGIKAQRSVGNDGLKVIAVAEAGVAFDTGSVGNVAPTNGINNTKASSGGLDGNGGRFFSRQIHLGLASDSLGQLSIGRQYTGSYIASAVVGATHGGGFMGNSATLLPAIGGMPTRVDSSVSYITPEAKGFKGWFTYTAGSENNVAVNTVASRTTTNDQAGQGWDAALLYSSGPMNAVVSTWNVKATAFATGETGLAKKTGWQAAASYDFGRVKIAADYVVGKISGGNYENVTKTLSDSSGWSVSASAPFGNNTVYASYSSLNDKSLLNRDGRLIGLGYTYNLDKQTKLYANWGKQINSANATYSLLSAADLVGNVTRPGYSPSGFMVGYNYKF